MPITMLDTEANLIQALQEIPPAAKVALILPFTPSILIDLTPILSRIYQSVLALPNQHFYVHFVTPLSDDGKDEQLYDALQQNPRANWDALQRFLAEVYATLSAAQWACEKVLLGVEVGFAQTGFMDKELSENGVILYLEGFDALIPSSLPSHIPTHSLPVPTFPSSSTPFTSPPPSPGPDVVALGGTFDHLHAAHKLLLHLAHFLARRKVIVGVMADSLLSKKSHSEHLQPISERIRSVEVFMSSLQPREGGVELDIVELFDAFGPTADDPDIQALVISDETRSGGQAVNDLRRERGLGELEVWCIDVIAGSRVGSDVRTERPRSQRKGSHEDGVGSGRTGSGSGILKGLDEKTLKEVKMGSTAIRKWLAEGGHQGGR